MTKRKKIRQESKTTDRNGRQKQEWKTTDRNGR